MTPILKHYLIYRSNLTLSVACLEIISKLSVDLQSYCSIRINRLSAYNMFWEFESTTFNHLCTRTAKFKHEKLTPELLNTSISDEWHMNYETIIHVSSSFVIKQRGIFHAQIFQNKFSERFLVMIPGVVFRIDKRIKHHLLFLKSSRS